MSKLRFAKKLNNNNVWTNISFENIKRGDIIQLLDCDKFPVVDSVGNRYFCSKSDAFRDRKVDVWSVAVLSLISCKESKLNLENREVERLGQNNKSWLSAQFENLKRGDIFRMYESDTKFPIVDSKNNHQFVARSNAYIDDNKWIIRVMPLMPIEE